MKKALTKRPALILDLRRRKWLLVTNGGTGKLLQTFERYADVFHCNHLRSHELHMRADLQMRLYAVDTGWTIYLSEADQVRNREVFYAHIGQCPQDSLEFRRHDVRVYFNASNNWTVVQFSLKTGKDKAKGQCFNNLREALDACNHGSFITVTPFQRQLAYHMALGDSAKHIRLKLNCTQADINAARAEAKASGYYKTMAAERKRTLDSLRRR